MQAKDFTGMKGSMVNGAKDAGEGAKRKGNQSGLVSFVSEIPQPLQAAMTTFIENHPNWDQCRLIQASLAGFLMQNGIESRSVTRHYLDNMFCRQSQ